MESLVSTGVDPRASDAGHHVGQKEGASTWTAVEKGPLRTVQELVAVIPRRLPVYFFLLSSGHWAVYHRF